MIKITIPERVSVILNTLHQNGYKAYVVGGCVRDSILNRRPNDWDITTNAKPEEVINLFDKVISTGLQHGTVTVMIGNEGFEVTTFRIEGSYDDNRHPNKVQFVDDLVQDLSRRDFTINAMAYNDTEGLIDPFNGLRDLQLKFINTVGNADERFQEDALRMLRAVRFSAQLGFHMVGNVKQSIYSLNKNIEDISMERKRSEFDKILLSNLKKIEDLFILGLLEYIIPELIPCIGFNQDNPHHCYDVFKHSLISSIMVVSEDLTTLRLTMLLHDICKPQCKTVDENGIGHFYGHAELSSEKAKEILKRLKYDNKTIDKVCTLIKYHDRQLGSKNSIKKLLNIIGRDLFTELIRVKKADTSAQSLTTWKEKSEEIYKIESQFKEILQSKECFSLKDLDINGRELIGLGFKGKAIGNTLHYLLGQVIQNPKLNNKNDLVKLCQQTINEVND